MQQKKKKWNIKRMKWNIKRKKREAEFKEVLVFIKLLAPWCDHCESMACVFQDFAAEMEGKPVLADLDSTVEEEISKT